MFYFPFLILLLIIFITTLSAPGYRGPVTNHFNGRKFINPGNVPAKGFRDVIKWMTSRDRPKWVEVMDVSFGEKPPDKVDKGIRITFVNHSTFLIQAEGLNILTDPVWSKRIGPFSWLGVKRMRPPGIRFEDLPAISCILLTHNHYDHLDIPTLRKLYKKYNPTVYTSLGVKKFLEQNGIKDSKEMDWWDELTIMGNTKLVSVPAQHFSGRGITDRDATLWCGFVLKRPEGNIYFAGDTGYNNFTFKEIGERCAPIKVALIPIGAYKPEWFMSPIHVSPYESVKVHQDVKSGQSIAMHFGTFLMADDGQYEPQDDLKKAMEETNIPSNDFTILKEGEGMDF